jgi:SpoIID/LytB domain protein
MRLNRRLACALAGWVLAGAAVLLVAPAASAALGPQGYGTSVRITGHGFGHGLGMGQVGAYGYATHFGWTWQQILAHFYPATTLAHANPSAAMTVRLAALDDRPVTAVVQDGGQLATSANGSVGRFKSIAAVAFAPGHYRVYARADAVNCPAATTVAAFQAPGSPWKILAADVASADITTPAVNTASAPVQSLPGVCEPGGDQFGAFAARYYRGSLRAVTGSQSELRTVNIVPVDLYVAGVVPREMPASWGGDAGGKGLNALLAQAVAARSYSLASNRYAYARICDNQNCQVYGGAGYRVAVNAPGGPTPIVGIESPFSNQAVAGTSGVVVTAGGAVVSTLYAASTGGYTATGIVDQGDQYSPFSNYHTWTATIAVSAIQAAYPQIGVLTDLSVTKRNGFGDFGGRVVTMVVIGTAGRVSTTGGEFRSTLGLRSDWFAVPTACDGRDAPPPTGLPPATAGQFTALTPRRVIDTRTGVGTAKLALAAGCTMAIRVAGGVLPAGASAAALNLTATQATAAGFLTAFPCGEPQPTASNLNYAPGESVANMAVVRVGVSGEVCIATMSKVHLVVDVLGWYAPLSGDGAVALRPQRVMDTRNGTGIGGGRRAIPAGGVQSLGLAGVAVPRGARSVVLNVTDTEPAADGYLTVYPCGTAPPLASNIDYRAGQTIANQVVVGLGANGSVCFTTFATSHVVVDLLGYYAPLKPDRYTALAPSRLLDTRAPNTIARGPIGAGGVVPLPVLGRGGVPSSGVHAAVLNVTVDQPAAAGYVTAFPCGAAVPLASNLDYVAGQVAANIVTVPIGSGGRVCLYTYASTQIVVDVAGYFR